MSGRKGRVSHADFHHAGGSQRHSCAFQKPGQRRASVAGYSKLGNAPLSWLFFPSLSSSLTAKLSPPGISPQRNYLPTAQVSDSISRETQRNILTRNKYTNDRFLFACSNAFELSPLPTKVSAIFAFWQLRSSTKWPPIFLYKTLWHTISLWEHYSATDCFSNVAHVSRVCFFT